MALTLTGYSHFMVIVKNINVFRCKVTQKKRNKEIKCPRYVKEICSQ